MNISLVNAVTTELTRLNKTIMNKFYKFFNVFFLTFAFVAPKLLFIADAIVVNFLVFITVLER